MPDHKGGRIVELRQKGRKKKVIKLPCRLVVDFPEIFVSDAWLSLGGIAPQVYLLFLCKRRMEKTGKKGHQRNICTNGRELVFTYQEAKESYELTQPRFRRAIDDLISKGLIDVVRSAGGLFKEVTLYGLSERWRKYGTPQFEEAPRSKRNQTVGFCKPKSRAKIGQEQDL